MKISMTAFLQKQSSTKTLVSIFLAFLLSIFASFNVEAQNAIAGSGFTAGWPAACNQNTNFVYFSSSAGSTYSSGALTPNGTGNQFWRLGVDWSGTIKQLNNGSSSDVAVTPGTKYTLNSTCTATGAFFRNVSSTSNRYIFKTLNAGTNPTGTWVYFELSGNPITVSSVSQNPASGSVIAGENVAVTAVSSGSLPSGQGIYLRYTKDGYTTSTVVEMTNTTGNNYTATIPGSFITSGASVSYYVFTSGSGLSITGADADLYTINLNNNTGSNYSFTASTLSAIYVHNFSTGASTAPPYTVTPNTFATNLSNSSWTNSLSTSFTGSTGSSGTSLSVSNSGSSNYTYTLTFSVASGYKLSISSFNFWRQRSTNGPQNWVHQSDQLRFRQPYKI